MLPVSVQLLGIFVCVQAYIFPSNFIVFCGLEENENIKTNKLIFVGRHAEID